MEGKSTLFNGLLVCMYIVYMCISSSSYDKSELAHLEGYMPFERASNKDIKNIGASFCVLVY